jgi:transposase
VLLTSMVRRTLDLKDHRVVEVRGDLRRLEIVLDRKLRCRLCCSRCGLRAEVRDRLRSRRWRHVPLWGIPTVLLYRPTRIRCPQCGIRVEAIPWSIGKSPLSKPLVVVLATWARLLAWEVVARLFGVSWGTVRAAVDRAVVFGLSKHELEDVLYLGIDEISRRRRHIYHTQVYDLVGKRMVWSREGRDKGALLEYFERLGPEKCGRIRAVCCDMWGAYVDVVQEMAPQALVVFDKFHILRHLLSAVDEVRKEEAWELRKTHPGLLKQTRFLWLKHAGKLSPRERVRLGELERWNLRVFRAYLLKQAFYELWEFRTKHWAKEYLKHWFWWATHSRLQPMRNFAWMLRRHEDGILNWFEVPIDNGAVEAMNNNAKAVSHRARGYRTAKTFTLALFHCLGKLAMPSTVHKFV